MRTVRSLLIVMSALTCFAIAGLAAKEKIPDLGRTKFKDIAKYLNLNADQQNKIKPDVDRIQQIVKDAQKLGGPKGGWGGGGARSPVGGGWGGMGRGGGAQPSGGSTGNTEQKRAQLQEWQKEITNRVDEIKSFLAPDQLEKFKAVQVPDLDAPGGAWY